MTRNALEIIHDCTLNDSEKAFVIQYAIIPLLRATFVFILLFII